MDWINIKNSQPTEIGNYPVSFPVDSPSPYSNDKIFTYSIAFWNGGAFWCESDRLKYITHWMPVLINENLNTIIENYNEPKN